MGYNIFSFGINPDKVGASIGSKDKDLLNEIMETEIFRLYSDQDSSWHVSTKAALEQIIFGKPYIEESAHSYWYALISICAHLGEKLIGTHEIKLGYETDLINGFMLSDFGTNIIIEEELLRENVSFGLPQVDDWPLAGILNKMEINTLFQKFTSIEITDETIEKLSEEDDEKEMAYDSIRQIKENLSFCLKNNLNLISFCH